MFEAGQEGPPPRGTATGMDGASGSGRQATTDLNHADCEAPFIRNGVLTATGREMLPYFQPCVGLVDTLSHLDPASHGEDELYEALCGWARVESWVAAQKARVVAALSPHQIVKTPDGLRLEDPRRELIATALNQTPRAAEAEVALARSLTESCHQTLKALDSGEISPRSAKVVVEETAELDNALVAEVEARVLGRAQHQTPGEVRRAVRRAVQSVAPQESLEQAQSAYEDRCVSLIPGEHGMALLEAVLPAHEAQVIYNTLTAAAFAAKNSDREAAREAGQPTSELAPVSAYRADALVKIMGAAASGLLTAGTDLPKIQAHVVLDLATALGLADNPAELRGYGPIPGPIARHLASDALWSRWLTSTDGGQLIDIGSRKYRPSTKLRELITARDQRCRFPGCTQLAQRCDVDHADAWDDGGPTNAANLGALCRRHHRLKTHTQWTITRSTSDGSCEWRSPTGHTLRFVPEPLLPEPIAPGERTVEPDDPAPAIGHPPSPPEGSTPP